MNLNNKQKQNVVGCAAKCLAAGVVLVLMTGCATDRSLYQWGGYDEALYSSYKNPETVAALQSKLEIHIAAMNAAGQKVAPGLYAELGSLYLQSGKTDAAIEQYRNERELWPESRQLMDSMIGTLESRGKSKSPDSTDNATSKEPA